MVTACAPPNPTVSIDENQSKEHFAESEYGVASSPRIASAGTKLRRGGGRRKVGNAYQVKGRWYRPGEDPDYAAVGAASWYGSAFHGRLTANGEVYDMMHLTAAHPTMPLPSYARVTNLKNGKSVIVRVNDRGPFAKGRIIDLSRRAAELLQYKHLGIAKVQVEYVGPAPLHGQDDQFLMASYRPGGDDSGSPVERASNVVVAMNDRSGAEPPSAMNAFAAQSPSGDRSSVVLPASGPVVPDRPESATAQNDPALLSYADRRVRSSSKIFDAVLKPELGEDQVFDWWARRTQKTESEAAGSYINLGAWSSRDRIEELRAALSGVGRVTASEVQSEEDIAYTLSLVPAVGSQIDEALRAAWASGASDAFIVRN